MQVTHALSSSPARRHAAYVIGALLLAVALPYFSGLGGPFLWDDRPLILAEPAIQRPLPILSYLQTPFWRPTAAAPGTVSYYRPLVTLSYVLDYRLHGENPVGFHVTNLAFHLLNCLLLFSLCRRLGADRAAAAAAAALWGLSPRLTESVTWISGRTDVLATTCALLSLWLWTRGRRVAAALALLLGLLCKEVSVAAVAVIVLWEVGRRAGWRATLLRLAPPGVALLGYGALRILALHAVPSSAPPLTGLSPLARGATVLEAIGWYALMLLDPLRPATQIGLIGRVDGQVAAFGAVVAVGAGVGLWRLWPRLTLGERSGALWGLGALGLVLHVVPVPVDVVAADRFLYVPLCGAAVALALGAGRLSAGWRRWAGAAALLVGLGFAAAVHLRNADWSDEVRFWVDAIRRTGPDNPRPRLELGNVYYRAVMFEDALRLYRRASQVGRGLVAQGAHLRSALANQANCLAQLGDYDGAERLHRVLIADQPDAAKAYHDLGLLLLHRGRFDEARDALREALRRFPEHRDVPQLLVQVEALRAETRTFDPTDRVARAEVLTRLGRRPEAQAAWLLVARQPGVSREALRKAVAFLTLLGGIDNARLAWQRLAEASPGDAEVAQMELLLEEREDLERRLVLAREVTF